VDENNPFLETQCLAVVEAMDLPAHLHRVSMPRLWHYLPLGMFPDIMIRVHSAPKPLTSPWPTFVMCGGKVALKIGTYLRKKHNTFTVALGPASSSFHKVLLKSHKQEEKKNTIMTLGPLHRIHPALLAQGRKTFYRKIDHLPNPRIGLLLEGEEDIHSLTDTLTFLYKKAPFSLMIYGKGLSEEKQKHLAVSFENIPHLLWKGQQVDPYLGFLAHSEATIVSNASSLMVAEASSLGKPLFIYPSASLDMYTDVLIKRGYATILNKDSILLSRFILPPLQEAQRVAEIVKDAYLQALANSPLNLSPPSASFTS
jgi:mitochondrial fission protein ELM1